MRESDVVSMRQAEITMRIEEFVAFVLKSAMPAYISEDDSVMSPRETNIGKDLKNIVRLSEVLGFQYRYSENISAFYKALSLARAIFAFPKSRRSFDSSHAEAANFLIEAIRHEAKSSEYRRIKYDRTFERSEKAKVLQAYTKAVLRSRAKTLVVRVDLGYEKGILAPVTIIQVLKDLSGILSVRRRHPVFRGLVGYAWAVEQSIKKGFHIHAIFFFDGSMVRQDVTIGFAIGDLWRKQITNGLGAFYNCNVNKQKYERCGIGMIHRNDEEACENTIRFVQYLTKGGPFHGRDDQYLRIKPIGARTFGTGQAPSYPVTRRGRPAPDAPWLKPDYSRHLNLGR